MMNVCVKNDGSDNCPIVGCTTCANPAGTSVTCTTCDANRNFKSSKDNTMTADNKFCYMHNPNRCGA